MILQIFHDTDLRNVHRGLAEIAKKHKVDVNKLRDNEHLIFLNSAKTKIKLYSSHGLVSYYVSPSGKLNLHMIDELPKAFGAQGFDWKKAERVALEKLLKKKTRIYQE